MSSHSGNKSLAKTGKKKMRLSRRNSIANVTSNFNSLRPKKAEARSKTTEDVDKMARIEKKLNRERDALKDIYDDAVDKGLNESLLLKLADDLEAKTAELEHVRNEYNKAGKSALYSYYARKLKESNRFTNNDDEKNALKNAVAQYNKVLMNDKDANEEIEKYEKQLKVKHKEFQDKYKNDEEFAGKIDDLRDALAKGDWVFMNDKHSGTEAFALARLLMEGADPGKLLLETPYSFNWAEENKLKSLLTYGLNIGSLVGPWPTILAKEAIANDWLPISADALSPNGKGFVEKNAVIESSVTGHNNKLNSSEGKGNWVRQNYIGRNVFQEIKKSDTGGIVILGTKHITGDKKTGESALQDIVSTQPFAQSEKIKLAKGDSTSDYFATVVPKKALNPDKPNYSSGPKIKTKIGLRSNEKKRVARLVSQKNMGMLELMAEKKGITVKELKNLAGITN